MSDNLTNSISIPSDSDGFVILQCSLCSEFFKITPTDFEEESQLQIWCPSCGLNPESFLTNEVMDLAKRIVINSVSDLIDGFNKEMNGIFKSGNLRYKPGSKIKKEVINPIVSQLENLEINVYDCCHKVAKISPSLKMEGGYCPFCGEMQNGN
ncbi:TFIIB-type zinc ribbon-containing protein [Carnobacterium maltaromaticum]|uniref:TFIIB-type zinc ribbon-containing protein n=1 Tax=Carnobacterium maltaromaticum TaxID=2751 RepID=UPI0039BEC73A